jgi:hypothetical protein
MTGPRTGPWRHPPSSLPPPTPSNTSNESRSVRPAQPPLALLMVQKILGHSSDEGYPSSVGHLKPQVRLHDEGDEGKSAIVGVTFVKEDLYRA